MYTSRSAPASFAATSATTATQCHRRGKHALALFIVLLAGLVLRSLPLFLNWHTPHFFMQYDSWGYHHIATNLLKGNGYSWQTQPPFDINIYRPPGLPLILLFAYSVFAPSPVYGIVVQVGVGTISILLLYLLSIRLFDRRTAFIATLILALDPLSIVYSNLLFSEVYSALILLATGLLAAQYWYTKRSGFLVSSGALLGLGIIIHPILLFLPFLFPLFWLAEKNRKSLIAVVFASTLATLPPSLWVLRNLAVADYVGLSSVTAVNLLKYKAAGVLAELNGTDVDFEGKHLESEIEYTLPISATPGVRLHAWQSKAMSVLYSHPFLYLKLHITGSMRQLFGLNRDSTTQMVYGSHSVSGPDGIVTDAQIHLVTQEGRFPLLAFIRKVIITWHLLISLTFLLGWVITIRRKDYRLFLALSAPILYVLLMSGGPESFVRFRVIYEPFVVVFSAIAFRHLYGMATKVRVWKRSVRDTS